MNAFLNPALMYAGTWTFVFLLYVLGLSELLDPLQTRTVTLVIGSSLAFLVGWVVESTFFRGRLAKSRPDLGLMRQTLSSASATRRAKLLWGVFFVGIFVELVYFRGSPLLSSLGIGNPILYSDFGIPGLHGLLNAIFYSLCVLQLAKVLLKLSKGSAAFALFSIGYPVLMLSRQILISVLVQYFFVYICLRRGSARILVRAAVLFVVAFLLFGYLGDLRSGREHIIGLAAPTFDYPEWLPSAFIWFYIYVCTPLANVNFNIGISPNYAPLETAGTLIPSFAREAFMAAAGSTRQWVLVNESFNVSSLLESLLTDFGVEGTIGFTLLCGILFSRLLRRSRRSPAAIFAVIVLLHGIALSFFANLLFHLVFVFEISAIAWVVARRRRHRFSRARRAQVAAFPTSDLGAAHPQGETTGAISVQAAA